MCSKTSNGVEIAVLHGLLQVIVRRRQLSFAVEEPEGVAGDEIDRRGRQADLEAVEIVKHVAVDVVDAAVRLVGDDQVEESHIEGLEDLLHRRVGGEEDAFARVELFTRELTMRMGSDRKVFEGVLGLLPELPAVAKEQDALDPSGADQQVGKRDRDAGLAGAGRLDDRAPCGASCENRSQTRLIASIWYSRLTIASLTSSEFSGFRSVRWKFTRYCRLSLE